MPATSLSQTSLSEGVVQRWCEDLALPDMRDPNALCQRRQRQYVADDLPGADIVFLVSFLAGVAGLMLRIKVCSWVALFTLLSSSADARKTELDTKVVLICGTLAAVGLLINYFLATPS
ncbi:Protein Asterix [Diplonema papillatum]|nr:Protein Asterix [Diplonema papillatum]|eukprot:gene22757-34856_t